MSREVDPQKYAHEFEGVTKKDGNRGYLVTHHVVVWLWFSLLLVVCSAVAALLYVFVSVVAALVVGVVSVGILYGISVDLRGTRILVTRRAAYFNSAEPWYQFEFDTYRIGFKSAYTISFPKRGANILRVKDVIISSGDKDHEKDGATSDIRMRRAGGGNAMTRAVNTLASLS